MYADSLLDLPLSQIHEQSYRSNSIAILECPEFNWMAVIRSEMNTNGNNEV
jgi:hypothetical protein